MRKRKLSVPENKTIQPDLVHRFIGLSLGGGKTDKTCLAVVEYFPRQGKLFLSRLHDRIKSDDKISGDSKIHELILQNSKFLKTVSFDASLSLPSCLTCEKICPGIESCEEPHAKWHWKNYEESQSKKRPKKLFTPYTQRCVEAYLTTELEIPFHISHAMGANSAPLMARALFIKKRLAVECIEVFPALTFYRLAKSLGLSADQSVDHRAAFGGDEQRTHLLKSLNDKNFVFIYNQDAKIMIQNSHAFDALLCALTGFLKFLQKTEKRPKDFPKSEAWIEFPKKNLSANVLFGLS
jgi:hypothetical protein